MIRYSLHTYAPDCIHGFGASLGQQHVEPLLDLLCSRTFEQTNFTPVPSEIVLIDFEGIEAVTASYLKALILPILLGDQGAIKSKFAREDIGKPETSIYPAVTGLSEDVREELQDVLELRGLPCLEALKWGEAGIQKARLLGILDPILKTTYTMLQRAQSASATQLHSSYPGEQITITGWNNRLADLHRLRLATRTKQGRQWIYEPISTEVIYGRVNVESTGKELHASAK